MLEGGAVGVTVGVEVGEAVAVGVGVVGVVGFSAATEASSWSKRHAL